MAVTVKPEQGPILKRNVNVFLLLIVIIIVAIGVAYSLTYQTRLRGITTNYENTSENLTKCTLDLAQAKQNIQLAISKINETERDVKTYDIIYEKKNAELETTKDQLATTSQDLGKTQAKLSRSEQLYLDSKQKEQEITTKYNAVLAQLNAKTAEVSNLRARVDCFMLKCGPEADMC